jgi:hypothetical protein
VFYQVAPRLQPEGIEVDRNPISGFFAREALCDNGLLSTLLFHAGVHLDYLKQQSWSSSTLYYRGETIQRLKKMLQSTEDAVSDTTIAMTAFMAATGVRNS